MLLKLVKVAKKRLLGLGILIWQSKRISLQEEKALELDIDVLLLKISSVPGTGAVKNGNIKEKTMYGKKMKKKKKKKNKKKKKY